MSLNAHLPPVRVEEKEYELIRKAARAKEFITVSHYIRDRLAQAVIRDLASTRARVVETGNDGC